MAATSSPTYTPNIYTHTTHKTQHQGSTQCPRLTTSPNIQAPYKVANAPRLWYNRQDFPQQPDTTQGKATARDKDNPTRNRNK